MNVRRKTLLVVLLILLIAPIAIGGIGTVELTIWVVLLAAWLVAFIFWAKNTAQSPATTAGHSA